MKNNYSEFFYDYPLENERFTLKILIQILYEEIIKIYNVQERPSENVLKIIWKLILKLVYSF